MNLCSSQPPALCLAPGCSPQFVFTDPGPQFVFTGTGSQFVFTGPGPKFAFTNPGPNLYLPALTVNLSSRAHVPKLYLAVQVKIFYYYHNY